MSARGLITDHLNLWTGAITHKSSAGRGSNGKIELTGIKKLRELILELAVRGKLVDQDPDDEPASVLLERIADEKARLVKEGQIKKPKKLPEIADEEMPFDLFPGWRWCRLGEIAEVIRGVTYKKHDAYSESSENRIALFRANNIQGKINEHDVLYIPEELVKESQVIRKGDILIAMSSGSANLVGKAAQADHDFNTTFGAFCGVVRQYHKDISRYIGMYTSTPAYRDQAQTAGKGIGINNLNKKALELMLVPAPPLEEQQRIVGKVDELMALCDRLEQQVGDQLEAHEVLVDSLLDALIRTADAAELADNWARIAEHFDTLFTTEASIDKLKQAILQLAVMGRLVPQDPDDEPASVLLKKIAEEKKRLVKEGKIKKAKSLENVKDEERSYVAHENWAWTRFQHIANEISTGPFGSMIHKHDYVGDGVPLINPSHMINGEIKEDRDVSIPATKAEELSGYKLDTGDMVMARRGEVGRCAIVTDREAGWLCGTGSFVLRFHGSISRRFILMMFSTNRVRDYLAGNSVGTTMTNLNHGILNRMPVALPPANEQNRIVEKVDELLALCDQLTTRLSEAGETRTYLAEAVVEQVV